VTSFKAAALEPYKPIPTVGFQARVIDGIVRAGDGTIPGGPTVAIPPPGNRAVAAR